MTRTHPPLDLALRYDGDALISAGACRVAAELGARHGHHIPAAAIAAMAARFRHRLERACTVAAAIPLEIDDD